MAYYLRKERMAASTRNAQPLRTCVATRHRRPREELLRVVLDPQDPTRIIPDPRTCLPGRGAWIEPTAAAYEMAEKRRALPRALKVAASVDTSAVREYVASLEKQQE